MGSALPECTAAVRHVKVALDPNGYPKRPTQARQREGTPEFAAVYAKRAGVEGTLSRGVRPCRLRRTRYNGQAKTHLGHLLTAVGLNFLRLGEWFIDRPRARSRRSPFVALMADAKAA